MFFALMIAVLAVFTIVMVFDLRDSSTHRWKKVDSKKRAIGHLLFFLVFVVFVAYFLLSGKGII